MNGHWRRWSFLKMLNDKERVKNNEGSSYLDGQYQLIQLFHLFNLTPIKKKKHSTDNHLQSNYLMKNKGL